MNASPRPAPAAGWILRRIRFGKQSVDHRGVGAVRQKAAEKSVDRSAGRAARDPIAAAGTAAEVDDLDLADFLQRANRFGKRLRDRPQPFLGQIEVDQSGRKRTARLVEPLLALSLCLVVAQIGGGAGSDGEGVVLRCVLFGFGGDGDRNRLLLRLALGLDQLDLLFALRLGDRGCSDHQLLGLDALGTGFICARLGLRLLFRFAGDEDRLFLAGDFGRALLFDRRNLKWCGPNRSVSDAPLDRAAPRPP